MSSPASRLGLTGKPSASRRSRAADWLATSAGAALLEELVAPGRQEPAGRDLRVLLAERARAGVARVGVERQARLLALGVDPGELGLRHEDLAARVERRRLLQPVRDRLDRPQVGRDVLAGRPVAPGRALDEPAALVAERDREAVDLELGDVAAAPAAGSGAAGRPRPRRTRVSKARSSSWLKALPSDSIGRRWRTSSNVALIAPPTRWVGESDVISSGMGGLEGDELAEQRVVLGVGELRRVLLVVEAVRALDRLDELGVAGGRGVRGQVLGRRRRGPGRRAGDRCHWAATWRPTCAP